MVKMCLPIYCIKHTFWLQHLIVVLFPLKCSHKLSERCMPFAKQSEQRDTDVTLSHGPWQFSHDFHPPWRWKIPLTSRCHYLQPLNGRIWIVLKANVLCCISKMWMSIISIPSREFEPHSITSGYSHLRTLNKDETNHLEGKATEFNHSVPLN